MLTRGFYCNIAVMAKRIINGGKAVLLPDQLENESVVVLIMLIQLNILKKYTLSYYLLSARPPVCLSHFALHPLVVTTHREGAPKLILTCDQTIV